MLALVLIALLGADELPNPGPTAVDLTNEEPVALESRFRLTLEVGAGFTTLNQGDFSATLDFGWLPLQYLRLHVGLGGSVLPGFFIDGALHLVAGADGVLPFAWGEAFAGFGSGFIYTNVSERCFDCGPIVIYEWRPTLQFRGGLDFTRLRPAVLGVALTYAYNSRQTFSDTHAIGAQGRVGFAF